MRFMFPTETRVLPPLRQEDYERAATISDLTEGSLTYSLRSRIRREDTGL